MESQMEHMNETDGTTKLEYEKPKVIELGSINELTWEGSDTFYPRT